MQRHTFLPLWIKRSHPIVQQEMRHWQRFAAWRVIRVGQWGLLVFTLVVAAGLAALTGLGLWLAWLGDASASLPPETFPLVMGGVFALTCLGSSLLANLFLTLIANIFAATLIARERETQAWPSLRLTPLTSLEIMGGKAAAYTHLLLEPALLIVILRLVALIGAGFTVAGVTGLAGLRGGLPLEDAAFALLSLLTTVGANAIWIITWPLEPFWSVAYNGALGLCVSSFSRTRRTAVLALFGLHLALLLIYWMVQQVLGMLLFFLALLPVALSTLLEPLLGAVGFVGISVLVPVVAGVLTFGLSVGVLLGALGLAYIRIERLSD